MIEDILNINTIFYVSFISLIIKNEKKMLQIQHRKQKKEDRIKRRKYRIELKRERLLNNDVVNNDSNDDSDTYTSSESVSESVSGSVSESVSESYNSKEPPQKIKATSNILTIEEKMLLLDTSLWDENV